MPDSSLPKLTDDDTCPYGTAIRCNQKDIMCSKGKFDAHCITTMFKSLDILVRQNHEALRKEGMEDAVDWLFDHGFILKKYEKYSISDIVELMHMMPTAK
jgi:hypothetical protein